MIVYYALGGGWGHISRARKLISQLGIADYKVVVSESLQQSIIEEKHIIQIPDSSSQDMQALKKRLFTILNQKAVTTIFLDSFPAGILGELNTIMPISGKEIIYVCRYLNWEVYSQKIKIPFTFDETLLIENIAAKHYEFVESNSRKISHIEVENLPSASTPEELKAIYNLPDNQKIWLIVHSSNKEELQTLVNYAEECSMLEGTHPFLVVISNITPPINHTIKHIQYYPASDFFPLADTLFTACGYNIMTEAKNLAIKHRFIPFERKYDDQFLRAKNLRESHLN